MSEEERNVENALRDHIAGLEQDLELVRRTLSNERTVRRESRPRAPRVHAAKLSKETKAILREMKRHNRSLEVALDALAGSLESGLAMFAARARLAEGRGVWAPTRTYAPSGAVEPGDEHAD